MKKLFNYEGLEEGQKIIPAGGQPQLSLGQALLKRLPNMNFGTSQMSAVEMQARARSIDRCPSVRDEALVVALPGCALRFL
ncbi:MAG: hypothetical protein KKD44_04055 [Proteobacteria bacterium]|nr:hypothetical protein [Pseudomonadota bacterium]